MKRVVLESPYKGQGTDEEYNEHIAINEIYGELCMHDCLVNYNESPYASHLLYTRTYVLRDYRPEQRKLGIEAGFYWRDVAEQSNFYIDLGMTGGMKLGIDDCEKKGKSYEVRTLPDDLWHDLITICKLKDYKPPVRQLEE